MRQHFISLVDAAAAPAARPAVLHGRTESGNKAILCGCFMVLVGMITYCFGALDGGPEADLVGTLFQNGILGWTSFVLLLTGTGVWLAGNIALVEEALKAKADEC